MWLAGLLLLTLGLVLLVAALRQRRQSRLPFGIVCDSDAGYEPGRLLTSSRFGLCGRPDYLIRTKRRVIPVELKPTADRVHASAVAQLMAYCILVEEEYGRPPYGLLVLRDQAVRIPYTNMRRDAVRETVAEMRAAAVLPPRSHHQPARCRACAYAPVCTEAL